MAKPLLERWANVACPVIGMVHLRPLAGAPRFDGDLTAVRDAALRDAEVLAAGGVDAVMIENFGDVPFYPGRVPAHVVAQMTAIAAAVRSALDPAVPLGINVLRNDGCSALAVAHAVGAAFIRVNVLCDARVTDQGVVQGIAHELMRERAALGAEVKVVADVDVKHSTSLGAERPLEAEVGDVVHRGLADAVIVTGSGTGRETDVAKLRRVKAAAGSAPVFVGSGVTAANAADYLPHADGLIVGSALKRDGSASNEVDPRRVRDLVARVREAGQAGTG